MQTESVENDQINEQASSESMSRLAAEALDAMPDWTNSFDSTSYNDILPEIFIDDSSQDNSSEDQGNRPAQNDSPAEGDSGNNETSLGSNTDSQAEPPPAVKVEVKDDFTEVRTFIANGHRVKITTLPDYKPKDSPYTYSRREMTVDGKRIVLTASAQEWFYSRSSNGTSSKDADSMPKIHIKVDSPADLAKVQASLLPVLERLIDQDKIKRYKTFDPNFADKEWSDTSPKAKPGPDVQASKGFTIYLPKEHALEVAGILDRTLVSQDLAIEFEKNGSVGDNWRKHTASARVSMERANWEFVEPAPNSNRIFHLLDAPVEKALSKKFDVYRDKNGRLTPEGLAAIEKTAGVEPGKLAIEPSTGRIALVSRIARGERGSGYVDESQANNEHGFRTGRPAMYALHELAGIDPVLAELDTPNQRNSRELPNIITKENIQQAKQAVEVNMLDVLEATYNKLARSKSQSEQETGKAMLESLSKSEDPLVREVAERVQKAVNAAQTLRATGQEPKTFRELLADQEYDLEKVSTGKKVKVSVGVSIGLGTTIAAGLSWLNSNRSQVSPLRDAAPKTQKK